MSTGYCYVAETPSFYKFGFSDNPRLRLVALRDSAGELVKLVGYATGSRTQEARLHELLNRYRSHGEWYFKTATTDKIAALFPKRRGSLRQPVASADKEEAKRLLKLCLRPGETFLSQIDRLAVELDLPERRVRAIRNGEARRITSREFDRLRRMAQRARDFAADLGKA